MVTKSEFEFLKQLKKKGKPLLVLMNVQENLTSEIRLRRFLEKPNEIFSEDKAKLGGHFDRIRRDAKEYYGTAEFPIIPVQLMAARLARQEIDQIKSNHLMKASRLQSFLDAIRASLVTEGVIRRSQNLLGSTVADIERPLSWVENRADYYGSISKIMEDRKVDAHRSIKEAQIVHRKDLENRIAGSFKALFNQISVFADENWNLSESSLNDAWNEEIRLIGFDSNLRKAINTVETEFSASVGDTLKEIEREIQLTSQLNSESFKLSGQESNELGHKTTKWGGTLLTFAGVISKFFPPVAAFSWGLTIAGLVLGFLSSFFESKAEKKRKAVAKISLSLETQIRRQEEYVLKSVMDNFDERSNFILQSVKEYFEHLANGTHDLSQALKQCSQSIETARNLMNICFASRILDFAEGKTQKLSIKSASTRVFKVNRQVGSFIEIILFDKPKRKYNVVELEKKLQEKVIIKYERSK